MPIAPLPAGWEELRRTPHPYAALYRFSCCGRRGLLLAVRSGDARTAVSLTAPPGGVILDAWLANPDRLVADRDGRCKVRASDSLATVAEGITVPLDGDALAAILAGALPSDATAVDRLPGWVEQRTASGWLRARVAGSPARVAEVVLGQDRQPGRQVKAKLSGYRDGVPGSVALDLGGESARLELVSFRQSATPAPPAWVSWPWCGTQ
jgi:hypothetical protein